MGGLTSDANGNVTAARAVRVDFILSADWDAMQTWELAFAQFFTKNHLTEQRYEHVDVYAPRRRGCRAGDFRGIGGALPGRRAEPHGAGRYPALRGGFRSHGASVFRCSEGQGLNRFRHGVHGHSALFLQGFLRVFHGF